MKIQAIAIENLKAHPANSNVMPERLLKKLAAQIVETGQYPPVVVRAVGGGVYQILDGHHRVAAIKKAGHSEARCDVWDVDDERALVLLATLNRLRGEDDPFRRSELLAKLRLRMDAAELAKVLPEQGEQIKKLLALRQSAPLPRAALDLERMPVAAHFFLLPQQKRVLEARLMEIGGTREEALMAMVGAGGEGESDEHGERAEREADRGPGPG